MTPAPQADTAARRAHWEQVFALKPDAELSWHQPDPAAAVARIARHVRPDAAVIDVGAGRGRLVEALAAAGFRDLTALDIAQSALDGLSARLGARATDVTLIRADAAAWLPDRRYALWHDRAALHFLTDAADRAGYLRALAAGTGAGSVVMLAAFAPDGPERCSGLPVLRQGAQAMADFLGPGFEPLEDADETHVTPWGAAQRFHVHVARRRAA